MSRVYPQQVPVSRSQVAARLVDLPAWISFVESDRSALAQQVVKDRLLALGKDAVPLISSQFKSPDATLRLLALEVYAQLAEDGLVAMDSAQREVLLGYLAQNEHYSIRHAKLAQRFVASPGEVAEQSQAEQIHRWVQDARAGQPNRSSTQQKLSLAEIEHVGFAYFQALAVGEMSLAKTLLQRLDQQIDTPENIQPKWHTKRLSGKISVTPLANNTLLLVTGDKRCRIHLYLLRHSFLLELERYDLGTCSIRSRPHVEQTRKGFTAYVGLSASDHTSGAIAVDLLNGKILWRTTLGNATFSNPLLLTPKLFVSAASTYHVDDQMRHHYHRDSGLYCLDSTTGKIDWFLPLQGVDGDQSPQKTARGVQIWTEHYRHPVQLHAPLEVDIQTGRVQTTHLREHKEPSQPPVFSISQFECTSQRQEGNKTGYSRGSIVCSEGTAKSAREISANAFEPGNREFEPPIIVEDVLFLGASIVRVKAALEGGTEK